MAAIALFVFLFVITLSVPPSWAEEEGHLPKCPAVLCGIGSQFEFSHMMKPECGMLEVKCSEDGPKIRLKPEGHWYRIGNISGSQPHSVISIHVKEELPQTLWETEKPCKIMKDFSLPSPTDPSHFSSYSYTADNSTTLYNCSHKHDTPHFDSIECEEYDLYLEKKQCPNIMLPFSLPPPSYDLVFPPLLIDFTLHIRPDCFGCDMGVGECHNNTSQNQFQCTFSQPKAKDVVSGPNVKLKIGLGVGLGFVVLFAVIGLGIIMRRRKQKSASALRNMTDTYVNMEENTEGSNGYFGVLVFSYKDLTEATNNFDAQRELGNGGFGTVYHGKLKDGREVAVKRLYEHNSKKVQEQFVNEIDILTHLRHKNLVSLYGYTSHHCRELLLVYEYISNGTVADHLHGDHAKTSPLTWPVRMSVAIETASALAYLHASDIVHRDVKTNNILLDQNFSVKVADFGLSRLFPDNATHVSTAPQGTPGYVDPEYHQCYQLTSKSDVYSFGVVLVELLSSLPAVDITRHRHEINLANLAISKIQAQAYSELIDQSLGFVTDREVRMMTVAVAELAFECLQQDKEMRPTMGEVLERLKRIKDGEMENGYELNMSSI